MEESGSCVEQKKLKGHYAREYAKEGTPLRALKYMEREDVAAVPLRSSRTEGTRL